jgi:ABC-2 type transport system ATP-binding protein
MSIQVRNLTKKYKNRKAVDSISFSINKGEIVGFLGPNGAGKTTVMRILSGFINDYEGEVIINEKSVSDFPVEIKKSIGYLPEHNPLYTDMYVKEYLLFHASIYKVSKEKINEIIKEVGLSSHESKKIKELSKGYRQRLGLATAFLHDPDVLILDEPTTGLDPNQLIEIRELIKKTAKDKIVLFSTHIMQEVEAVCNRVIIINKGQIVTDQSLSNLKNNQEQVVSVEFNHEIKQELLIQLDGINKVLRKTEHIWELSFIGKQDKRAAIFDFAQQNNLKILSMNQNSKNLENLFHDLTR